MANKQGWSISGTKATYYDENVKVAEVSGLRAGLKTKKVEISEGVYEDKIEGIEVDSSTITLSENVLGYENVKLTYGDTYSLALGDDVHGVNPNAGGWLISGTTAYLLDGSSSGYAANDNGTEITYTAAKPGKKTLATLKGLKEGLSVDKDSNIKGISVSGTTVTINSKDVLDKTDVTIDNGYKLAVGSNLKAKPASDEMAWTVKGTNATSTTAMTSSYALDNKTGAIKYVEATNATVTLSGLKKNVTADEVNKSATVSNGVITLTSDVLGTSKVTVKGADFKLALADNDPNAAEPEPAVWKKAANANKATYVQTFSGKGKYYSDGSSIVCLSKESATVTLATLSGLAKTTAEWDNEEVDGIDVKGSVITLSDPELFTTSNITLGKNDGYDLAISSAFAVDTSRLHWDYNADKGGTAKIVRTTEPGYEQKDSKTVNYLKSTSTTLATVSGLPKGLVFAEYKADEDKADTENTTDVASTGTIAGLTFDPSKGTITVAKDILESADGAVLDKATGKTGIKKLTLGAKDEYVFAFASDDVEPENNSAGAEWVIGKKTTRDGEVGTGTWTYTLDTSEGWEIDKSTKGASKTINYVPAKTTTIATVSGLTTDCESFAAEEGSDDKYTGRVIYTDSDGKEHTALTVTEPTTDDDGNAVKAKIVLNKSAFAGKKISLKSSDYILALADDYGAKDISEENATWVADTKGKAVLTGGKSAGYEVDPKTSLAINYTAPKVTAYATITGLTTSEDADAATALGEALDKATTKANGTTAGTITLSESMLPALENLTKTNIALGAKDNYKFVLNTDGGEGSISDIYAPSSPEWEIEEKNDKLTGNVLYKATMSPGYLLKDAKTVNYKDGGASTIFTLSGLSKDDGLVVEGENGTSLGYLDDDNNFVEAITLNNSTKKVTLIDAKIFGGTKISLKNGADNYALEVGDKLKDKALDEPAWDISGGKAVYYEGTKGGYAVDAKGTTASYTNPKATKTLATITGLAKNTDVKEFEIRSVGSDNLILVTANALTTSAVKLTGDGYKLSLYGVPSPVSDYSDWVKKDATATKTRETTAGWTTTSDGKTINYSKEKTETAITVSGLKKGNFSKEQLDAYLAFDSDNKTVTVSNELLDKAKVSLKSGIKDEVFTIKLAGDVTKRSATEDKTWTVSGGKASYNYVLTEYYSIGSKNDTIEYTKEKVNKNLATISGLKKTATEDDFELSNDGVITLKSTALDTSTETAIGKTKVTLKGDGYTLALGENLTAAVLDDDWGTVDSKGKVLYERGITTDGYVVSADKKTISYGKDTDKKTTLATLNGVGAAPDEPDDDGVITITSTNVDGKKITLGNKDPYTLALDSGVVAPTASGEWTVNKGTATLKGTKTAGYLQTDSKTIGYTAETASGKTETLATIKGVTSSTIGVVEKSSEVQLKDGEIGTNVTIDGKGILSFVFPVGYGEATVNGSATNDSFTFEGTKLKVNTGKGNDYVNFNEGGENTFVYTSGDGYDEIADFTSSDNLEINKAKKITPVKDGDNVVVNVDGKGSITLTGYTGSTVRINGSATNVTTASSDLLLDDNYSMDAAALSEIVTANTGSYSPYQFSSSLKLTKEENFLPQIAYASDKK